MSEEISREEIAALLARESMSEEMTSRDLFSQDEIDKVIEGIKPYWRDDAISRQAAYDLMRSLTRWCVRSEDGKFNNVGLLYDDVMFGIDKLPSVTPKQSICIDCQHLDRLRKKCTQGRSFGGEIDVTKVASCGAYAALGEQDQTAKADKGKARVTLVPMDIVWAIAAVREFGTAKYKDPDNWKRVDPQRFRDAMARHMLRYLADPTGVDDESGLPHLWHALCNGAFLCALDKQEVDG